MAKYTVTFDLEAATIQQAEKQVRQRIEEKLAVSGVRIEKHRKDTSRADRLSEAETMVQDAATIVDELRDEMQSWYDNMPENLQNGDKGSQVQECSDNLESLHGELENLDFSSVEFPGMFG